MTGFGTFEEIAAADAAADQFPGEITIDEEVDGNYGPRWHFGVTPEDSEKTLQCWASPGRKTALMTNAMLKAGVKGKKPACGELLGIRGIWERRTQSWTDKTTGEERESKSLIMIKLLGEGSPKAAFDDDDVVNMLAVLDGKKSSEYQRGIMKEPLLSNAAKVGILDGSAIKWLVSEGYATLDGDTLHHTDKVMDLASKDDVAF